MNDVHQIYRVVDEEWSAKNSDSSFHSIELIYVSGRDDCAMEMGKHSRPFSHWALGIGPTFYYFLDYRNVDGLGLRRDLRENLISCKPHPLFHSLSEAAARPSTRCGSAAILLLSSLVTLRWEALVKIAQGYESRIFVALLISLLVQNPDLLDALLSDAGLPWSLGSDGFIRNGPTAADPHPNKKSSSSIDCVIA